MSKTPEELALEAYLQSLTEKKIRQSDNLLIAHDEVWRKKISNTMRGKTLEELLGAEKATEGRKKRSINSTGPRPEYIGKKIAATRRAQGSYDVGGMAGKQHREETKAKQSTKAQIRQDIKRELGLGRNDSIPKDILAAAYKKHGV